MKARLIGYKSEGLAHSESFVEGLYPMTRPTVSNSRTKLSSLRGRRRLCALFLCFLASASRPANAQPDAYDRAEILLRNHQWDQGISVLEALLRSEPRNLKALNLAGLAFTAKGDSRRAEEYFKQALAIDSNFVPALKNLSISEFNAEEYVAAREHLKNAEQIAPQDPVIHLYLGEIFFRQGSFEQAVQELSGIDDLAVRNPVAGAHLTICYLRLKDQAKALESLNSIPVERLGQPVQFEMAVALDNAGLPQRAIPLIDTIYAQHPESYEIGFDRMMIYLDAKRYAEAIDSAKQMIVHGHETAELNAVLAEAYESNSKFQLAFDAYRRAINLAPDDEQNYIDLASLCMNRQSLDAGMKVIEVALASHPKSGRLVFMRGLIHATQGEFELAEKDFALSEKLSPREDLGTIGLGASYLESGRYDQATHILRANLKERPNDPSLLYLFGESLVRSGASPGDATFEEARGAFEKSTALNPNLCLPHIALGIIYLDEKRAAEAVKQFEMARSIDPTERSALSHLIVAYRRLGQMEKAGEVLGVLKGMTEQDHNSELERLKAAAVESTPKQGSSDRSSPDHP